MKFHCIAKTSALIAGLMTITLAFSVQPATAESFLDKLNKKLEQANIKVQKNAPNQPASGQDQVPANRQSKSGTPDSGQVVVSNTMRDVDIVGLKIGMTVAEARAALKARKLPKHEEVKVQLTYHDSRMQRLPVPDGEFLSEMMSYETRSNRSGLENPISEVLWVFFTPVPGKERAANIYRAVSFSKENELSEEEFVKTLTKKYGSPAANNRNDSAPFLAWGMPAPTPSNAHIRLCGQHPIIAFDSAGKIQTGGGTVMGMAGSKWLDEAEKVCGNTYLYVELSPVNMLAPPAQRLLSGYTISFMSPALIRSSYQTTMKITAAAQDSEKQRQLNRAKSQRTPDL